MLNESYVALAIAARKKKLSFDRWPFRWLPSDSARLPWTEFDRESNSPAARLICPDATIELLQLRRRIFVELETGTHTLGFNRDGPSGRNATKTKIERYTRFVLAPASSLDAKTYYGQTFADEWPSELVFIVPSAARRHAIAEYVNQSWRPLHASPRFSIRALTIDDAPAELCRAAQLAPEISTPMPKTVAGVTLTTMETRAVYDFYNAAIATIAGVRQFAKTNPHLAASMPAADYPANHETVKQICVRLGEKTR